MAISLPKQIKEEVFRFCLLKKKDKIPFEDDWQILRNYTYNNSKLLDWLANGGNYGCIGGYGNLRILDIDDKSLVDKFTTIKTFKVRTGSGGVHIYFKSTYNKNHVLADGKGELRADRYQVVGANCTHPNGGKYEVIDDSEILELTKEQLRKIIEPYLKQEETEVYDAHISDTTRSGIEFGEVCRLARNGLSKEKIFERMSAFEKWKHSHQQYKEITYKKAIKKIGSVQKKVVGTKDESLRISSIVTDDFIVEQVYSEINKFAVYDRNTGDISYVDSFMSYKPITDEEVKKGAIRLPEKAEEYIDEEYLDQEIKNFINKWLDVPEAYTQFAIWNIKQSWVYDRFHTLAYLRALGDTGSGKSRFLDTLGYLHYKPIFTSGALTAAVLFRIINKWKGTMVIDEADFKKSDASEDIMKIINQGYEKQRYVMRCDKEAGNKVEFFDVYCPKLIATRRTFYDKATEARCVTHVMVETKRGDIPPNLDEEFFDETMKIRNKLLMWRFKNYDLIDPKAGKGVDLNFLEPRLRQVNQGFLAMFAHSKEKLEEFKTFLREYQNSLIEERRNTIEGGVVEGIYNLVVEDGNLILDKKISSQDIINANQESIGDLKPRKVTSILKTLGFGKAKLERIGEKVTRIIPLDNTLLPTLFKRYGVSISVTV